MEGEGKKRNPTLQEDFWEMEGAKLLKYHVLLLPFPSPSIFKKQMGVERKKLHFFLIYSK